MDDLSAYYLVTGLIKRNKSEVKELSLAYNPLLGFAFFSKVVDFLASWPYPIKMRLINLEFCTISV